MKKPETCSHCKYFEAAMSDWICSKDYHILSTDKPSKEVDKDCPIKPKEDKP